MTVQLPDASETPPAEPKQGCGCTSALGGSWCDVDEHFAEAPRQEGQRRHHAAVGSQRPAAGAARALGTARRAFDTRASPSDAELLVEYAGPPWGEL
ncbi:MAG: hypothetical protein AMXMBFR34_03070 [Myxococcaceae bacterium]